MVNERTGIGVWYEWTGIGVWLMSGLELACGYEWTGIGMWVNISRH